MIAQILGHLFSYQFAAGVVFGLVGQRLLRWSYCKWQDYHDPYEDGSPHTVGGLDMRYVAAVVMIGVVGWSVYKTQANSDDAARITRDAREFSAETRQCQRELIDAINKRAIIAQQNEELARDQRESLAEWLRTLLNPPPEIAERDGDDPVRQQWAVDVTRHYFGDIEEAQEKQAANDEERKNTPLPQPKCGGS